MTFRRRRRLVHEAVGELVVLPANMGVGTRPRPGPCETRRGRVPEVGVLDAVLAAHLLHHELRVGAHLELADAGLGSSSEPADGRCLSATLFVATPMAPPARRGRCRSRPRGRTQRRPALDFLGHHRRSRASPSRRPARRRRRLATQHGCVARSATSTMASRRGDGRLERNRHRRVAAGLADDGSAPAVPKHGPSPRLALEQRGDAPILPAPALNTASWVASRRRRDEPHELVRGRHGGDCTALVERARAWLDCPMTAVEEPGAAFIRPDGKEKVTGAGRYTADLNLTGQVHAAFRYADHTHARIRGSTPTRRARCPACSRCSRTRTCPTSSTAGWCRTDGCSRGTPCASRATSSPASPR